MFCLVRLFCFGFKTDQYVSTASLLIPGLDYNTFIFGHKPKYGHPRNMAGILKIYMFIVMQLSALTSTFALLSTELNVKIMSSKVNIKTVTFADRFRLWLSSLCRMVRVQSHW